MNDDQSFYEIQLNTPHLVLAFLGAAVVGVAIFWLGVVIGRGQTTTGGPSDFQAALPVEQGGADDDGEGGDLGFHEAVGESGANDSDANAGAAQTVPPPAESTLPAAEEPAAADPASGAPPDDFRPADPVQQRRDPVAVDSDRAPAAEPAAQPAAGLPRPDASLVAGWVIQVRSTPEKPSADALQEALATDGFPAFVMSVDVNGTTYYRVRVGRYRSQADAQAVERALRQRSDIEDAWVTEG